MQEGLSPEHRSEEFSYTLEHLLDCCGISQESHCHLQALWWDIADSSLDIVWNPFHKVRRILVLHIQHLLINLLGAHASAEQGRGGQVATMTGVSSTHHILGVKHLLSELWYCKSTVLLGATGCEGREANHEEMEARERNQVDSELAKICIQLTRESKARGHTAHGCTDE